MKQNTNKELKWLIIFRNILGNQTVLHQHKRIVDFFTYLSLYLSLPL